MTFFKRFTTPISMGALAVLLAACGSGSAGSGPEGDEYVVGISTSITGPAASIGAQEAKGAEYLFDKINENGGINGRKVRVEVKDNQTDPQEAVLQVKEFTTQDVDVVMVGSVSTVMTAIEPLVQNTLTVNFGGAYKPPADSRTIFSPSPDDATPLAMTMKWLKDEGITRFAAIASTDTTGQYTAEELDKVLAEPFAEGLTLTRLERFDPKAADVTAQLSRLAQDEPEAVLATATGAPAAVVAKNYSQLGLSAPLILSWGAGSFSFAKSTESFAPENLYVPVARSLVGEGTENNGDLDYKFADEYQQEVGEKTDIGALLAYDPVLVVQEALSSGDTLDERIEAIESISDMDGTFATYTFSKEDHKGGLSPDNRFLVMARIDNGDLIRAE